MQETDFERDSHRSLCCTGAHNVFAARQTSHQFRAFCLGVCEPFQASRLKIE